MFAWIMTGLAAEAPGNKTISIDATYFKAHRTASSLGSKGGGDGEWRLSGIVFASRPAHAFKSAGPLYQTVPPSEPSKVASSCPPAIMSCNSSGVTSPRVAVPKVLPRFSTVKRSPTAIA